MVVIQVLCVIFGLFMLYVVRIHKRKNHLVPFEYGAWTGLWIAFIVLTVFPQSVRGVAERLNVARVFDLLVIIALMITVFLTFYNRIMINKLNDKLESVIRKKAIDEREQ